MAYFTIPYQIHFEDTMAYESHHYLTNFRFQCAVREALYFSHGPDGNDLWREDLQNLVMLTYEGYSRNLAPQRLGDRLTLFLTIGESSRSSMQLCIRAVSANGTPVTVGYQRFLCIARDTRDPVLIPRSMTQYKGHIDEPLTGLVFEQLARKGGRALERIFTPEVKELARAIAGARDLNARFVDGAGRPILTPPTPSYQAPAGKTILLLPGQGSYDWATLHELYHAFPSTRPAFEAADAIARTQLGHSFLPLVLAESAAVHDQRLAVFPDLDQLGIYLLDVLTARLLRERGLAFDLVAGHSFGEIAALAASGAVSIETGLTLVSQRILALQTVGPGCGAMAALAWDEGRARAHLAALPAPGPVVAVLNHPKQTVVSGPHPAIAKLTHELAAAGVAVTRLGSRYPFHSPLLAPAVGPFAVGIGDCAAQDTTVAPLFSPSDGQVHRNGAAILSRLPLDLIRPLDFHKALQALYAQGVRTFIQGGHGSALAKIAHRSLAGRDALTVLHCAGRGTTLAAGLEAVLRQAEAGGQPSERPSGKSQRPKPAPMDAPPAPPREDAPDHLDRTILAPLVTTNETPTAEPVAIVAMGCVLPGARNVTEFWHNALAGRSGIVDLGQLDPSARADFHAAGGIQPDKTYSLLVGATPPLDPAVVARLPYSPAELSALSHPETLLAVALSEALTALRSPPEAAAPARTAYVIGATADGSMRQDLAHVLATVNDITAAAPHVSAANRAEFAKAASTLLGLAGPSELPVRQHRAYEAVFQRLLGAEVCGHVVDTACSSALYAIALAMRALSDRTCEVAIAGGVYEVTMGNSCLFSQFGGLSATGSRAMDASADGVVFGSGAAVLILKRLADAIAAGDRVLGVIRGVGLSSDGKSPAVNVPQSEGQILAMQRAYRAAGLSPHSIQLIEAHATATPVGDATELKSLNQVYAGGQGVELRSVKSLIGHTGWAAGAASIIAICKAIEECVIPPQHGFSAPSPAIDLAASPFVISTAPKPWPARQDDLPRRAAVDGFGFGGTNAHLIMESYVPAFHRQLLAAPARSPKTLAVVGMGCFFPGADGTPVAAPPVPPDGLRLVSDRIELPAGRRVLPDVVSAMDDSQRLALLAAQDALHPIFAASPELARQTGIVLGLEGKTARGIAATERIFRDRLIRLCHQAGRELTGDEAGKDSLLSFVSRELSARNPPTGPYTLSGAMPNVAAGRVANFFNLKGPNLVVDAADGSLLQALKTAAQVLGGGDCDFMLAGAVNALAGPLATPTSRHRPGAAAAAGEAVILLAVARPETAAEHGLRPIALLELAPDPAASSLAVAPASVDYRGATGAAELASALQAAAASGTATLLRWSLPDSGSQGLLRIAGSYQGAGNSTDVTQPLAASGKAAGDPLGERADPPAAPQAGWFAPVLVACAPPKEGRPRALGNRRVLFVCDQPDWFARVSEKALPGLTYRVACPPGSGLAHGIEIDPATEETVRSSVQSLRGFAFDTIIAVKNLADAKVDDLLRHGWDSRFLTLLFAVTRYAYEDLAAGAVSLALLVMGGIKESGLLHPQTGLLAGYLKSLARELPQGTCRIVQTDQRELAAALAEAAGELAQGGGVPVETCFVRGRRHEIRLAPREVPAAAAAPELGPDSVVLFTGGARGVTAILAEALLERFGCRAVLLGRSAPDQVAPHLLAMTDEEFAAWETDFLTQTQAAHPGLRISDARQRYQVLVAARQTQLNLSRLKSLPGSVEYHAVDVTSLAAVEEVVRSATSRLGPIHLVVHGAGVQHSKRLPRRKLAELHQTINTKLLGLQNLHTALRRHAPAGHRTHYHLLTSAFSVLGNDGQPDYGAANEAMNRLAVAMARAGERDTWSALGWLGWDRIGMTQGSEYTLIQQERGLHAITATEGKAIFLSTITAAAPPAVTVLLGPGERRFYKVEVAAPTPPEAEVAASPALEAEVAAPAAPPPEDRGDGASASVCEWTLSLESHPYLAAHLVRGKPTLPGTFELELAARTAQRLYPEMHLVGFQRCRFTRFVPLRKGRATRLRCESRILQNVRRCTRIQLRIVTDVVHSSGLVLQSGVVHMECEALLSRAAPGPLPGRMDVGAALQGTSVPDPYTDPRALVFHGPPFDTLRQAIHGAEQNHSRFHPPGPPHLAQLTDCITPFLLTDAAFKAAHLTVSPDGDMPVCVIAEIDSLYYIPGLSDAALAGIPGGVVLASSLPRSSGELLLVDHVEARNAEGTVLAVAGGMVARPVGRVPVQCDTHPVQ